jgi:putative transposase
MLRNGHVRFGGRAAETTSRKTGTALLPDPCSYVRTWLGFVYVAFIVDVFAQRIIAWHAATSKVTELVMIPLRMALWQRTYEGHPAELGQLIHHSDAGSQYTSIRFTDHLDVEQIAPSIGSVGDALLTG